MTGSNNPDVYLLYEYSKKLPYTVRIKYILDEPIDETLLKEAANEAISRFPYFSVKVTLDEGQNYVFVHNEAPLPVLPEKDARLDLGGKETEGHLFAITWRGDAVWFNFPHSVCGGYGALFWIKTTLYQYLTKKHGALDAPKDLKMVGTPVEDAELVWPDADKLPKDEPLVRYTGGSTTVGIDRMLKYLFNPFARDNYYYQVEIPADTFMAYARSIDGSPNSVLAAIIYKATSRHFKEKEGTFLAVRIADDYRDDVGASGSYRDYVRLLHVRYDWDAKDKSIEHLNTMARGAIMTQALPELSYERFRMVEATHKEIDALGDLKSKRKHASKNSLFLKDDRDTCTISYVGRVDYGQMAEHIRGVYTITDGDMMLEVNALPDKFCISLQMINKDRRLTDHFTEVLDEEGIPYTISGRMKRHLPTITLPKP